VKHEAPETSPPRRPVTERPRSAVSSVLLVCGLAGVLLYVARAVFIPIALAILFALLLSSPVEALHRRRFPRSISALLILLIFLSLVGETVNLLWTPAQTWLSAAPRTSQVIQRKIRPAARIMERIDTLSNRAGHLADGSANGASATAPPAPAPRASDGLLVEFFLALWFGGWFWGIAGIVLAIPTLPQPRQGETIQIAERGGEAAVRGGLDLSGYRLSLSRWPPNTANAARR
jgi:predicted PurR-regulated permease PerM